IALIFVAFLPYSYDPAGPFEILPSQGSEVIARTDGVIVDVMVHEGDWVSAGQVLAHLSSSDQQRDVAFRREELDRAETRLAQLGDNTSNSDQNEPVQTVERESARNEVERLRLQLDHDQTQLDHTTVRAPAVGFVTTPNPQFLTGVWLNAGEKFLQIDDTKVVEAEIEISQDDIALIKPGAKVRLRPWSERDREIVGRVTDVAPTSLDKADNSVRGAAEAAGNAGMLLPAAMTGNELTPASVNEDNNAVGVDESAASVETSRRHTVSRRERGQTA